MHTSSAAYWRDVSHTPVLSTEAQLDLARAYAASGDRRLAHRLITANLRLVMKIARELATAHDNFDDLVQEGNAGLMQAVERFDPRRGTALTTYAGWWIRAFVRRYQMEHRGVVRTGTTRAQRKDFFAGRGVPGQVSLDGPSRSTAEERAPATPLERLPARDEDRPDRLLEERDFQAKYGVLLSRFERGLDARGRAIVRARWCDDPAPLKVMAEQLSISGERTRQLEIELRARLTDLVRAELVA